MHSITTKFTLLLQAMYYRVFLTSKAKVNLCNICCSNMFKVSDISTAFFPGQLAHNDICLKLKLFIEMTMNINNTINGEIQKPNINT